MAASRTGHTTRAESLRHGHPPGAILLDIGGTLWPDRWPTTAADAAARAAALRAVVPALGQAEGVALVQRLEARAAALHDGLTQDTRALIARECRESRLPRGMADPEGIRRAMCLPAYGRVAVFTGARDMLATARQLGLACVVVTNALWRDGRDYRRDFAAFGLAPFIDAVVSSVDVGFRKPHRAIFEVALAATGCPVQRCVVIGNSERNDIQPALALGMRAVRVAIEEGPPATTVAHAVAGSLHEIVTILRAWGADEP